VNPEVSHTWYHGHSKALHSEHPFSRYSVLPVFTWVYLGFHLPNAEFHLELLQLSAKPSDALSAAATAAAALVFDVSYFLLACVALPSPSIHHP
jgi:hypothetical protein